MTDQTTVAGYLKTRLEEFGLDRLFGVAGNYTAPFLDTILEDPSSPISVTGIPNELVAGYATDGYARIKGIGAVAVTYGVGAFSLVNAVAGAFVEYVPLVVINGAPTNKEFLNLRFTGLLYSHMMADPYSNLDVFRRVTVAAERIVNAAEAPYQIDAALAACVSRGQPVYLEVLEDVWRAPCAAPRGPLPREQRSVTVSGCAAAVAATIALVRKHGEPLVWAGVEVQRAGLQDDFLRLVEGADLPFTTSVLGKSVVSEDHPLFRGVYTPTPPIEASVRKIVEKAGCLLGLGAWTTGKDVANQNILGDDTVLAQHGGVIVGPTFYPSVDLGEYIRALYEAREELKEKPYRTGKPALMRAAAPADPELTYDLFFAALGAWMRAEPSLAVVSDAGFPLLGAQALHIPGANGFVAQASWLAIGYSTAASIGVKCAMPDRRVLVVVGDGAFQETAQAVSSHAHLRQNTVVFVLANGIYGIEQRLVNPNPFRDPATRPHYRDPLLNEVYPYNDLHPWAYEKLADVFGGVGRVVGRASELAGVLDEIRTRPDDNFVVHVKLPADDTPAVVKAGLAGAGEDETENPAWPPANLF